MQKRRVLLLLHNTIRRVSTTLNHDLCPFCNDRQINDSIITYSPNRHFMALYNHKPVFRGHTLIVARSHIPKFNSIPVEHIVEFYQFQRDVISALLYLYNTESYDMLLQEGELSGQSVQHLHIHLLPRIPNDLPPDMEWMDYFQQHEHTGRLLTPTERQFEAERIRQAMKKLNNNIY
jgi:bis(5'-adenosyl)-triphosphatase